MDKKKREKLIWGGLCIGFAAAIMVEGIILFNNVKNSKADDTNTFTMEDAETKTETKVITEIVEKEKVVEVEVEKEITQKMIQDGLNDMGVLTTEEYYFTQVEEYTKTKTYANLFTTESNFMYSYDGVVTAGIDMNQIVITKDNESKIITVSVPRAEIQNIDIDYESFKVYSEKEGLWNPISVADYNDSMIEFENKASEKALNKGILDKADEKAQAIIENFIKSLVDSGEFEIIYEQMAEVKK